MQMDATLAPQSEPHASNILNWPPPLRLLSPRRYILKAIIELTISLSFSLSALTAFFRDTLACAMTNSISLASSPESSTSSPSSSSSSFLPSPLSIALPLPESCAWSWPACASALLPEGFSAAARLCAACDWACWFRSSILASPKMLGSVSGGGIGRGREGGGFTSRCCLRGTCRRLAG